MPVSQANVMTTLKPQSFMRLPHSQGNYGNQVLTQEGGRAPLSRQFIVRASNNKAMPPVHLRKT